MDSPNLTGKVALVVLLLGAAAMSGCLSFWGLDEFPYESYREAMEAPGPVATPDGTASSVRLKLLEPVAHGAEAGTLRVIVLLFDNDTRKPIEGVDMTLEAHMPAMGHGTTGEKDPEHRNDGLYVGETKLTMDGTWEIRFTATSGSTLEFVHTVMVGSGAQDPHPEPDDGTNGTAAPDANGTDDGNATDDGTGNETDDETDGDDGENTTDDKPETTYDNFTGSVTAALAVDGQVHEVTKTYNLSAGARLNISAELTDAGFLTEFALHVVAPDGETLTTMRLDGSTTTGTWSAPAAMSGDHQIQIEATGVLFAYAVSVAATY